MPNDLIIPRLFRATISRKSPESKNQKDQKYQKEHKRNQTDARIHKHIHIHKRRCTHDCATHTSRANNVHKNTNRRIPTKTEYENTLIQHDMRTKKNELKYT